MKPFSAIANAINLSKNFSTIIHPNTTSVNTPPNPLFKVHLGTRMNTKTLSPHALSVIEHYTHFKVGSATCSIPYFNNKTTKTRGGLRVRIGKGSPKEILEEVETILVKMHVDTNTLSAETLKKLLTDENIGIDCSGFAYYVLNAQLQEDGKGALDKHISFVNCHGILGKIRAKLRPVENCDVATLSHDRNSTVVPLKETQPGDIITMITPPSDSDTSSSTPTQRNERDHILVIHQVEYQNFSAYKIHYTQAVAYPEDGVYGTGIKQGTIEIHDHTKPLTEALWTENGVQGSSNRILIRAQKMKTEVRRIR